MPVSILYAISAMFLFGTAVFFYKLGTPNFSPGIGAAIFIASHLIPLSLFLIFEKTKFDISNVKFLILGGIIAGLAQIAFFLALKEGKINTVVPIRNLALLVTVILGIIFLAEKLTIIKIAGIGMAIGSILLLSL